MNELIPLVTHSKDDIPMTQPQQLVYSKFKVKQDIEMDSTLVEKAQLDVHPSVVVVPQDTFSLPPSLSNLIISFLGLDMRNSSCFIPSQPMAPSPPLIVSS